MKIVPLALLKNDYDVKDTELWTLALNRDISLRFVLEDHSSIRVLTEPKDYEEVRVVPSLDGKERLIGSIDSLEDIRSILRGKEVLLRDLKNAKLYSLDDEEIVCSIGLVKPISVTYEELVLSQSDSNKLKAQNTSQIASKTAKTSPSGSSRKTNNELAAAGLMLLLYLNTEEGKGCFLGDDFQELLKSADFRLVDQNKLCERMLKILSGFPISGEGLSKNALSENLEKGLEKVIEKAN